MDNFLDVVNLTLKRIGEDSSDTDVLAIVKEAINHSYVFDLSKIDKRFSRAYVPAINGMATLPDDIRNIEKITPELTKHESRRGNVILTDRSVTFEILYSVMPELLVNDTDIPDLSKTLWYLLSTYACYEYYTYRKKTTIAQSYLQKYEMLKSDYQMEQDITGEEYVQDAYETVGDE